jgi:DNA-binding Lrp family transcriptional regulator
MVTAITLMNVEKNSIEDVAQKMVDLKGVIEVHSVAGQYDLVSVIRTKNNEDIADLVTNDISKISGVTRSETLMAFKVYSDFELERMFSVGL